MYFARTALFLLVPLLGTTLASPVPSRPNNDGVECIEPESGSKQLCKLALDIPEAPSVEPIPIVKCPDGSDAQSCVATASGHEPISIPNPIILAKSEGDNNDDANNKKDEASLVPTPPGTTTRFTIPTIILLVALSVSGIAYAIYKSQAQSTSAVILTLRHRLSSLSSHLPHIDVSGIRKYIPIPTTWRMSESRLVRWAQEDMGLLDITEEDFEQGLTSSRYAPKFEEFEIEEPKLYAHQQNNKGRPSAFTNFTSRGGFVNYGSAWQ